MIKRCIFLHDLHSALTRCSDLTVDNTLLCQEHLDKGRKEKIAVLVVPEIRHRLKKDYPHTTIELKFDKE